MPLLSYATLQPSKLLMTSGHGAFSLRVFCLFPELPVFLPGQHLTILCCPHVVVESDPPRSGNLYFCLLFISHLISSPSCLQHVLCPFAMFSFIQALKSLRKRRRCRCEVKNFKEAKIYSSTPLGSKVVTFDI